MNGELAATRAHLSDALHCLGCALDKCPAEMAEHLKAVRETLLRLRYGKPPQVVKPGLIDVPVGSRIMCQCGDPLCYSAIEVLEDTLIVYEDVSDPDAEIIAVALPENVRLMSRQLVERDGHA